MEPFVISDKIFGLKIQRYLSTNRVKNGVITQGRSVNKNILKNEKYFSNKLLTNYKQFYILT